MKFTLSIQDGISPKVAALLRKQSGAGRKAALEVMGIVLRDWAMEAFTDAGKRPAAWKAKLDGTASTLQGKSPVLRGSLRVEATEQEVSIGTDRKYALIHQVGGVITAKAGGALRFKGSSGQWLMVKQVTMPARPYLPVLPGGGILPAAGEEAAAAVLDELTAV